MSTQPQTPRVHMLLPIGDGGIFQHGVEVARLLEDDGVHVTLHMSDAHEEIDLEGLDVCRCVRWRWRRGRGRKLAVVLSYLLVTQPHLMRAVRPGEVLHLQGLFYTPLALVTLALARLTGRRVVHSPHNTFSRSGQDWDKRLVRVLRRLTASTIVFSRADAKVVAETGGGTAEVSPLVQVVPLDQDLVDRWRARWREAGAEQVVLLAGQIRPDKRPDLLLRSAVGWPAGRRLAFAGEDKGAWDDSQELARTLGVEVVADVRYLGLDEFTAALAAADVVVCPYDKASQSGVISVARSVGTATVATDVGGLGEAADISVPPGDVAALSRAIASAFDLTPAGHADGAGQAALGAHLAAYAKAEPLTGVAALGVVVRSLAA